MGVLVEDVRSSECGDQQEKADLPAEEKCGCSSEFFHCATHEETVSRFDRVDFF
jgi:hypothetical protein